MRKFILGEILFVPIIIGIFRISPSYQSLLVSLILVIFLPQLVTSFSSWSHAPWLWCGKLLWRREMRLGCMSNCTEVQSSALANTQSLPSTIRLKLSNGVPLRSFPDVSWVGAYCSVGLGWGYFQGCYGWNEERPPSSWSALLSWGITHRLWEYPSYPVNTISKRTFIEHSFKESSLLMVAGNLVTQHPKGRRTKWLTSSVGCAKFPSHKAKGSYVGHG